MIPTHAKPGSRRRDGRDLVWGFAVWGLAALAFACALLGRPHPAEAGDCSQPADCRYVPDNGNAVLPVAAGATGVAVGTGLRGRRRRRGPTAPVFKPPKEYTDPATGGARDNPFDPPVDEQRDRWTKDHLIWDPQTLSWRPPKPGEVPPPPDAPENTPFQRTNPRDGTPPECLDLYDEYVQAERDVQVLEVKVQVAANRLQNAQLYLNQNLVKLTLQLQMDTADIFMAGASGVKSGMAIATAAASAGAAIGELLRAARTKLKYLEEVVARLIESAGQLAARLARIENSVSTFGATAETAAAEVGEAEDAVTATRREVGATQEAMNAAAELDDLSAQRNAVVQEASEAEQKLAVGEQYWERKKALKDWANSEQAAAREDNNRAFARVHGEEYDAQQELERLRASDPQEIEAAHQAEQAKLEEAGDVRKEIDDLKVRQQKQEWAKQLRDDAAAHLNDEQADVSKLSDEWDAAKAEAEKAPRAQLEEAREQLRKAQERFGEVDQELADVERQIETPSPEALAPEQRAQRQALADAQTAAKTEFESAKAAYGGWEEAHPGERLPPEEIAQRFRVAEQKLERATRDLDQFDSLMSSDPQVAAAHQPPRELLARREQLKAARQAAKADVDAASTACDTARGEIGKAHSATDAQFRERWDRATSARDAALKQLDHAEAELTAADQRVQEVDLSKIPSLEDRRQQLLNEYNELRAKYEKLKSGTFADEKRAAELQAKIQQLQQRMREWKDPDWEDYAAQHDPQKYQQWKLEVEGTDPAADEAQDLDALRKKVAELKEREDGIEKRIGDLRDKQRPGESTDALRSRLEQLQQDLDGQTQVVSTKKSALDQAKQQLDSAQAELTAAKAEQASNQQQLQQAETDRDGAQAEVDRLQSQQGAGGDMMQAPQGVVDGVQQGVQDAAAAAAAAKQYIADKLRAGVSKVGKAWEWAFNGQSPDEIAAILKNQHDNVQQRLDELNAAQQALDQARQTMRDVKPRLDACTASHQDTA